MATKIGKKPAASKSSAAVAKRPAVKLAAKEAKNGAQSAAQNGAKSVSKNAPKPTMKPSKAAKPAAKAVAAKAPAAKPVVKAASKPLTIKSKAIPAPAKPVAKAKPAPIPAAPKSAVITAYMKPSAKTAVVVSAEPAKKPVKVVEAKPVRLPPPPVRSDSKMAKNRAGLSAKDVEHFRDLLLEKRRELLGDVSSMETSALRSGNSNLSTLPMHMADSGTDNYEQEFTLGLVEKDRQLMREINVALAKVQDGSYGICEGTGKPIAKPRLEAQPWAKYSIEHARALEKPQFRRAF